MPPAPLCTAPSLTYCHVYRQVKRLQRESPHGRRPGWALRCVVVKNGDDCRQVREGQGVSVAVWGCLMATRTAILQMGRERFEPTPQLRTGEGFEGGPRV